MEDIDWIKFEEIIPDNFPAELKELNQWVCWRLEWDGKRYKKVPYSPATGRRADPTDPEEWSDLDTALEAGVNFDGVGSALIRENGLVMLDLDHCIDPVSGKADLWAHKIVVRLNSYTALSPSRTGLRILIRADHPQGRRCKTSKLPWEHSHPEAGIEIYGGERYTTLTGHLYRLSLNQIRDRQKELDALYDELFPTKASETKGESKKTHLSDQEIIESAMRKFGEDFEKLLRGPTTHISDDSKADWDFCVMLASYSRDPAQIDRIVRESALIRDKWDEIHDGIRTYGTMTIEKVLNWTAKYEQPRLKLVKVSDLKNQDEPTTEYVWGKVLSMRGSSLLVAKPKIGKSTLALNLAVAVSRGDPFLDLPTKRTPVWYLGLGGETKSSELTRFFEIRAVHEGVLVYAGPSIPDLVNELRREFQECTSPPLVIIDTLGKAIDVSDLNAYAEVNKQITFFTDLAAQTGSHIMMIHHAKKNAAEDVGDGVLGSTAIRGAVETLLYLDKKGDYRRIVSEQRYGEPIPETLLMYDPYTCTLTPLGEAKAYERSQIERQIIVSLQSHKDGLTMEEISASVEARAETIRTVVFAMVERGKVVRTGAGKRGDPYIFRPREEDVRAA